MFQRSLVWAASLIAVAQIAFPQNKNPQTISLVEPSCRNAPDATTLAQFVDVKTGTILTADSGLKLINLLLTSAPSCDPLGPSYVKRNFRGLVNPAYQKVGDELLNEKRLAAADFIVHVARWADPAPQSALQAAAQPEAHKSDPQLTVEQQRWYLIHKGQFLRPGRMFGAKTVYFIYLHLNKDSRADYTTQYSFGITQAIPQNEQNLQLLASILAGKPITNALPGKNAVAEKLNIWGGMELDMWYSTADITVDSSVTDTTKPNSAAVQLDQTLKVHNESLGWWDVSAGIPISKMSQLSFQGSSDTLVPQTVDKKSIYALMDFYPLRKQRLDLAYGNFSWIPSLLAGVPVTQQPLHQPLFAVGWGPRFVQFYFGAIVRKQAGLPSGGALAPGTSACTGWCPQFAFGVNIGVKALQSALSSKPAAAGGNGNSKEGAGTKATTGAAPPAQ